MKLPEKIVAQEIVYMPDNETMSVIKNLSPAEVKINEIIDYLASLQEQS